MTTSIFKPMASVAILLFCCGSISNGQGLRSISLRDPSLAAPAGGNGDSYLSWLDPNGRYVLFSSTANNLCSLGSNQPLPSVVPALLNVFLRDLSNSTTFLITADSTGTAGVNEDVTAVCVSTNGRFALFESRASNLVAGDNNEASDVFLRDVVAQSTLLLSRTTSGTPGNGDSQWSAMTPDGKYVAFFSDASNLVPNDANQIADLFVRNLETGEMVLATPGAQGGGVDCSAAAQDPPGITPDGRYVVFHSVASNLVAGVKTADDIYIRDLSLGTTLQASSGARAAAQLAMGTTNIGTFNYAISDDGQFVVYEASPSKGSTAALVLRFHVATGTTDLVSTNAGSSFYGNAGLEITPDARFIAFTANANDNSGNTTCVLVWDANTQTTTLVSGDQNDAVEDGTLCLFPTLDAKGRFVAFVSNASGLVTNELNGEYHLYYRDIQNKTTTLLDADASQGGSDLNFLMVPSMSADGRVVAFEASDNNLVPNDRNRATDVFLREPGSNTTELVSSHDPGLSSLTANGESTFSGFFSSSDGQWAAFSSDATDLVKNDTNGLSDVFVRDLVSGTTTLVSVSTNGSAADGDSAEISMTADGGYVVFSSRADNLVAGDTNNSRDVFLRDLRSGITTLVSVSTNGIDPGNSDSYSPTVSADARFVLFLSTAGNLTSATARRENLFLRDRQAAKTYGLTTLGVTASAISASGQFVLVLENRISGQGPTLKLWDTQATTWVYSNSTLGIISAALSPNGTQALYVTGSGIYAVDWKASTNRLISALHPGSHFRLRFSADGRYMVYGATLVTQSQQIFVYDFQAETNQIVSRNWLSGEAGDGPSDEPDISADGRFIAYRSSADDLVPGGINGSFGIFLYDQLDGTTRLVSANQSGTGTGNNLSLNPLFSGDGQTLFFQSWASDLLTGDFNASADIFMFKIDSANSFYLHAATENGKPWIYWTALPGKTYKVQFKNALNDGNWQDASEVPSVLGTQASWKDTLPFAGNRFYRVVSY